MLKFLSLVILLTPAAAPSTPDHTHGVPPGYQQVSLNGQTFTIPDNMEVELIAGPPLVDRPVHADFDEQGNLYVADSSGTNDRPAEQLKNPTHRLVKLVDSDGDGKFDKSTVFAENVPFPEGAMWYEGSFYVAAPPSIWKFTDKDGDGVAEERTEWFQGKTLTGCGNDLHGPYRAPDGWIYWCKGAFAEQTYERPGQAPFVTRASHIFRCRPDGSGIEHVMTGGMDNPVEVAFTNGGERIFTTTFFMHPAGGQRDGMIHAIYGGVYGKIHDVINGHPRTGDIMPVLTHFGPAAPAGLTCSQSAALGEEYQGALYSAQFSLHKIGRHRLIPQGASFKTEDSDLILSDNLDFHPTDVLEDADGSMIVVDTGPWYKMCCPSSQLAKPDILGAIYRVRRKDAPAAKDPRGLALNLTAETPVQLVKHLADSRHVVAQHAGWELSNRGDAAVPALEDFLQSEPSPIARRQAVWTLCRTPGSAARQAVRRALTDVDEDVRQVAIHSISLHRDATSIAALERILTRGTSAHNKRAAAESLGRLHTPSVVPTLLSAAAKVDDDRILEHSITYALIELGFPDATRAGLASNSSQTIRTSLIALDQMSGGGVAPGPIASYLVGNDPVLKTTALWLVDRHPEWGSELAAFLRDHFLAKNATPAQQSELIRLFPQLAKDPLIQQLIADG
ncbi:MAG: HEAT repeat domain-containing protein, partial [Planctomycetaceae bacterium]|nr:HEAT repeat domain-containing protein [Planctomycetaceae bacterium]